MNGNSWLTVEAAARLYCVRNFGSGLANEVLLRLREKGLTDDGGRRDFKVLFP